MPVSLRKLLFCCWQCTLSTNIWLMSCGPRNPDGHFLPPFPAFPRGRHCPGHLMTGEQVAVLTSRNHDWEKYKGPASEHIEQPVSSCLNLSLLPFNYVSGCLAAFLGRAGKSMGAERACLWLQTRPVLQWTEAVQTRRKKLLSRELHQPCPLRSAPALFGLQGSSPHLFSAI